VDQADEYRALCLIALQREPEAERVVERLVSRHPLPLDGLGDRSPKFSALYQSVRQRLLPRLVTEVYASAKDSFERKDYSTASSKFDEVLELLRSAQRPAGLGDLELLAREFRALAEQRVVPVETERPAESAPTAALNVDVTRTMPAVPAGFVPVPRLYDITDVDVIPPVVLNQAMPAWSPLWPHLARRTFTGKLQIIVSEDGRVTAADILQPSFSAYDGALLGMVKQWRYQPAMKQDHPVQYRRTIDYVLKGSDPTTTRP
jgi:TonB family protein